MTRDQSAFTNNMHASYFSECVYRPRVKPNMWRRKYKSNVQSDRRIYSRKENRLVETDITYLAVIQHQGRVHDFLRLAVKQIQK
jgi:hypothetical protein